MCSTLSATPLSKPISPLKPWIVCFSASLFFFYEFIQMNMFNAISMPLMAEFHLDAVSLGWLSSIYFYSNVLFLLPAGTILDRFSTRRVVLIALTICVIGTVVFALSTSAKMAGICRFFTAIGSAFCFLSCVRLASRWFSAKQLALITGLIVTMAMLGGMVAQTPLTLLVHTLGWRPALLIDAGLGVIILGIIAATVQDYPPHLQADQIQLRLNLTQLGYWKSLKMGFLCRQNWLCGIYTSLLNLPIFLLGGLWGILYLVHVKQLSETVASVVTSMLFLGTIIGSPIAGWLSDRLAQRRGPMIVGALASLFIMLLIMSMPEETPWLTACLFFLLGFVTSTQIISYPMVAESNSRLLTATAVSVVSICAISGGAIFEPLFGWLVNTHWSGKMVNDAPLYTGTDFAFAMWLFPAMFLIGLLATLFLNETHGTRSDNL